jgi:AraC-like DNA-binding protein
MTMTVTDPADGYVDRDELLTELTTRAMGCGPTPGPWPGLVFYRYTAPTDFAPVWIDGLTMGVVAQGHVVLTDNAVRYPHDASHYLVISSHLRFRTEVVAASPQEPCVGMVLPIEPAVVRAVAAEMLAAQGTHVESVSPHNRSETCFVAPLHDELAGAVVRFLRALSDDVERNVLAPLYIREIVYRVMRQEHVERMLRFAARHDADGPLGAAFGYVDAHLAEPLTVAVLAEQVNLSPSAFTRAFRERTGRSPYQYVKELRLDRARSLLLEQRGVGDVALAIGYASTSHFIKEFRTRFGTTPGAYAQTDVVRALRSVQSG